MAGFGRTRQSAPILYPDGPVSRKLTQYPGFRLQNNKQAWATYACQLTRPQQTLHFSWVYSYSCVAYCSIIRCYCAPQSKAPVPHPPPPRLAHSSKRRFQDRYVRAPRRTDVNQTSIPWTQKRSQCLAISLPRIVPPRLCPTAIIVRTRASCRAPRPFHLPRCIFLPPTSKYRHGDAYEWLAVPIGSS